MTLLRASGEALGIDVDLDAAIDPNDQSGAGVQHGAELVRFATASQQRTDDLDEARAALRRAAGDDAVLEAAATIAIFAGLVRVADGTGIQLDAGVLADSSDFRGRLGLNSYGGAENSTVDVAAKRIESIGDMFG